MSSVTAKLQKPTIQKILAAAEVVFAEKGFAAARVDDVAARAGVAKSHLYYHFSSKEQLLAELVQWRTEQLLAEKDTLLAGIEELTPDVVQRVIGQSLVNLLGQRRNFVRLALLEGISSGEAASPLCQMARALLGDTLERFETLGFTFDPQEFTSALYYFGLLPAAMHVATGAQWAAANGMTAEQNDEWFMRTLAQLELSFIGQLQRQGGQS